MDKKIKKAFDVLRADPGIKARTIEKIRKQARKFVVRRRLAATAASLAILLGCYGLYVTPVSAISVDTDEQIVMNVNCFGRVVSCEEAEVCNMGYADAVKQLTTAAVGLDCQTEVTVVAQNLGQQSRMMDQLRSCVNADVGCYGANTADMMAAQEVGLSMARYRMLLKLQALDATVMPEDVACKSMAQLRAWEAELSAAQEKPQEEIQNVQTEELENATSVTVPGYGTCDGSGKGQGGGQGNGQSQGNGNGEGHQYGKNG